MNLRRIDFENARRSRLPTERLDHALPISCYRHASSCYIERQPIYHSTVPCPFERPFLFHDFYRGAPPEFGPGKCTAVDHPWRVLLEQVS